MLDFSNLEQYRENNRIEAKRALGGFPRSVWETYSAFANTLGGIILLGVEEHKDGSLHPIDLPDPRFLVREFWRQVNDPRKASANILAENNVQIHDIDGNHIVSITIPRAQRFDRPVFIDGNPLTGTYRRSGEGDYRCTREEVESMQRDAAGRTLDMKLLSHMSPEVLEMPSLHRYRSRMERLRPGHSLTRLDDRAFLLQSGALGQDRGGGLHPTGAGLLMFGTHRDIVREFPHYLLDYREQMDGSDRLTYRLVSSSGHWSGNLFDFYTKVYRRIAADIRCPLLVQDGHFDDTPVHQALREALANSLVNADYYGKQGLVILKRRDMITISNPGAFRIAVEAAKSGGRSDPRNGGLVKLFHLIDVGGGTGSGIPRIYSVWQNQGWAPPTIEERFDPERITLSLRMEKAGSTHPVLGCAAQQAAVVEYLTDHVSAGRTELAGFLGVTEQELQTVLSDMESEGTIARDDTLTLLRYRLKS